MRAYNFLKQTWIVNIFKYRGIIYCNVLHGPTNGTCPNSPSFVSEPELNELSFNLCVFFSHRKQFSTSSTVHSTETMFLPRLQWDPRPASYNVQTTVLPMDMYVHISAYIVYFCSILSACHLMFIVVCRLQSCSFICLYTVTFVFTLKHWEKQTKENLYRQVLYFELSILK